VREVNFCYSPTQLEMELDLIMGRNPPTPPNGTFKAYFDPTRRTISKKNMEEDLNKKLKMEDNLKK
jgi:hypothetical protein